MNARRATLIFLLSSAALSFFSGVVESVGYELFAVTVFLGLGSIICVIVVAICAPLYFRNEVASDRGIITCSIAALPFVIGLAFELAGDPPNVHGVALPLFFLYALTSELVAAGIAGYLIVRRLRR